MTLTIVVITNKTKLLENFTRRLSFADEVIFVYEVTQPVLETKMNNVSFLFIEKNSSFANKRNLGLAKIKTDWALFVDDDEIVSEELALEIKEVINKDKYSGYYLTRHDICFYQELKYGEIMGQKILRLAKTGRGEFTRSVHEVWNIEGKVGYLKAVLYHQKDNFVSGFLSRIRQYGPLDADSLNQERKPFSFFKLLIFPKVKFFNNYILKLGFLDGIAGLFLAYLMSIQSLSVRIYQWEKSLIK